MTWTRRSIEEVVTQLRTEQIRGLDSQEAKDRLSIYGLNQYEEEKKETLFQKIWHHLIDISTIILLVAAAISAYMAITVPESTGLPKMIVILSIVVINVVLGVSQESRAEKALDALKDMNAPFALVIRDGKRTEIESSQIVPGDIIEINAGDIIPADARLFEISNLQVEESALTGESVPVEKDIDVEVEGDAPLGDHLNMIYSGCLVANGRAKAIVVETGMNTEMGKIAGLLNNKTKMVTPLQARLKQLAKRLSFVALLAGVAIFAIGVLIHQETFLDMLLISVSLAVAAVPETLPVIVTLILSNGVQKMVGKKTLIRRIIAVETIGNTSVICSDKTGTLTQNKMAIQKVWVAGKEPINAADAFSDREIDMLELLAVSTNATLETDKNGIEKIIGDPTEASIIRLLIDKGIDKAHVEKKYPRIYELPFDSTRKRMTTVHQTEDGYISITKGAFDRIPVDFESSFLEKATEIHDSFADKALRVIAVGYKKFSEMPDVSEDNLENDIEFLGIVGMIDPPRPESKTAVALAKRAGIKTVMITGDHKATASAIAKEIGIMEEGDRAVTGAELSHMNEEELRNQVREISVYARVSPEDKIRIVQAWQSRGEVITMTGDGVNDAPALKAADVGAAMGITGTEVSKNSSDMVITDDNFATIVDAVKEGRTAFDNIRKTISFLLSVNFAEIFIMLIGIALGWGSPLLALQLLFINVVADGIPGFFIANEKAEKDIMERKPIRKDAGIFSNGLGNLIAKRAVLFVVLTLIGFYVGQFIEISSAFAPSYEIGVTMAFIILSYASVINIFSVRSKESIFKTGFASNPKILMSAGISIVVSTLVATIPAVATVFQLVPMSGYHWVLAIGLALAQLVAVEIEKFFLNRK